MRRPYLGVDDAHHHLEVLPSLQVVPYHLVPAIPFRLGHSSKPVAWQINYPKAVHRPIRLQSNLEVVDQPRSPRCLRHPHQLAPSGKRVDHRGLSNIRSSDERDLGQRGVRPVCGGRRAGEELRLDHPDHGDRLAGSAWAAWPRLDFSALQWSMSLSFSTKSKGRREGLDASWQLRQLFSDGS